MDLIGLVNRVRGYTRDFQGAIFREVDVKAFLNEGIDRVKSVNKLSGMVHLTENGEVPILLPEEYHYLIALYSASRCFFQDEQQYQATTLMNEFEIKLEQLSERIDNEDVIIKDSEGVAVVDDSDGGVDYVVNWYTEDEDSDLDLGVEGL